MDGLWSLRFRLPTNHVDNIIGNNRTAEGVGEEEVTYWVCSYCIATKGLKGHDLANWPAIDDHEAQYRHIESEHHIPVIREGETNRETMARFKREQPEAGGPKCKCPSCQRDDRYSLVDALRL